MKTHTLRRATALLAIALLVSGHAVAADFFPDSDGEFFNPGRSRPVIGVPGATTADYYTTAFYLSSGAQWSRVAGTLGPVIRVGAEWAPFAHVSIGVNAGILTYTKVPVAGPSGDDADYYSDYITVADTGNTDQTDALYLIDYAHDGPVVLADLVLLSYLGSRGVIGPFAGASIGTVIADAQVYLDWGGDVAVEHLPEGGEPALPTYTATTWKLTPLVGYRFGFRGFVVSASLGYGVSPGLFNGLEFQLAGGYALRRR